MNFALQFRQVTQGRSQDEIAAESGVHQTAISRYLRGESLPGLRNLEALERAYPELRRIRHAGVDDLSTAA